MSKLLILFILSVIYQSLAQLKCTVEFGEKEYPLNGPRTHIYYEQHTIEYPASEWTESLTLLGTDTNYVCIYVEGGNTLGGATVQYLNETNTVFVSISRAPYLKFNVPVFLEYQQKQAWFPGYNRTSEPLHVYTGLWTPFPKERQ